VSWLNRVSNLFHRNQVDEELDEEMQFHLEARTRANLNAGMTGEEAQHDADDGSAMPRWQRNGRTR
jgi:hypothetical protein